MRYGFTDVGEMQPDQTTMRLLALVESGKILEVFFKPAAWRSSSNLFSLHHHHCRMDLASAALSGGLDPTEPGTYAALSKSSNVPPTTLWYYAHRRPSRQEKAKR
jgi:hypothetical protein